MQRVLARIDTDGADNYGVRPLRHGDVLSVLRSPQRKPLGARARPLASLPAALAALTKGGLNAITRSLAIEYAGRHVRVNAVSPGAIKTPMHSPEAHDFLSGLQPMGRMGEMQEVTDAVMYLEKAAFVTGEILHVDGGASAGRW